MATVDEYFIKIQLQVQGDKQLQLMTNQLDKARQSATSVTKPLKRAAKDTRLFGRSAANASYQLQDFVVQTTNGVDPMRALSQQLPQLFTGFNAWTAALGLAAAILPIVVIAMRNAEDEVIDFDAALGDLTTTLGDMTSFAEGIDFSSWNKEWNEATQSVKETELALLQFRVTAAGSELRDVFKAFSQQAGEASGASFAQGFLAMFGELVGAGSGGEIQRAFGELNFAEQMGIDRNTADMVITMIRQFEEGALTLDEFQANLLVVGTAAKGANKEFFELIEALNAAVVAQAKFNAAQKQAGAASGSFATGGLLPTGEKDKKTNERTQALTGEERQIRASIAAYDDYLQGLAKTAEAYTLLYDPLAAYEAELAKIVEVQAQLTPEVTAAAVEAAAKKFAEATKEFSLAEEAILVFDKSFQTMLNGVLMGTQTLAEGFKSMAKVIIAELLKLAAYQFFANMFGITIGGVAPTQTAKGNAFNNGNVIPFANGGIVNGPTVFPMAKGVGLMGEAGPEAVMPLTRLPNGNLGVESAGMNVTINNLAPGVDVRTSQGDDGLTIDVVMATIANAVQRGGNNVADAMEQSYSLNRGRAVY